MSKPPCGEPEVSVIVPTLNERDNIRPLYEGLKKSLEGAGLECFEIVFVDDSSTDGTIEEVERLSRSDPRVRLIVRRGEKGLSRAVLEGLRRARGRVAVVMDADLQHPPETVPLLVEKVAGGEADLAVASRYAPGGRVEGWSLVRRIISRGAVLLAWLLIPESRRTRDPVSGFFAVNLDRVRPAIVSGRGFKILLEILYTNPYARVVDVPFTFRGRSRGSSKLGPSTILDYLLQVLQLSSIPRFIAVGALGSLVNLAVYTLAFSATGLHPLSSILGFEAGLIHNAILHDRITFRNRSVWRSHSFLRRLAKYHATSAAGIAVGVTVSTILYSLAGLHPLLSQALGIGAGFIVNFTLASRYIWR
ncbi:dolichol-phosphate mannosyltransferase [Aeropyrum pernix]|uniref:Dolichol-phosphate mannosyltransferase n=1 Tax=Aeropyrum pernix TaxID=56636 RepID=A0A401H9Q7_AERPX|nr:glycosyltransferase [Aeropyrum pernix]GBF09082.1 dolichol-phosphate mannosyltransferase [Aeropyrum pernix]